MKKVLYSTLVMLAGLALQSCLHDNDDAFDTPAAQRIEEAVAADKALLESASNGWKLEYWLGEGYIYGGYNFLVKFANGKADVSGEIADTDMVTTSSYNVVTDQGPVLTFDTQNVIMHYLSQPYQSQVEGYQGDYEFVIMKTTNDSIYLKGKKWGNKMVLTRMPEETKWEDYLDSIASIKDRMFYTFEADFGSGTINVELDTDNNLHFDGESLDEEIVSPIIFTTTGMKLREPITINGTELQNLTYNYNDLDVEKSTLVDQKNSATLKFVKPDGWQGFDEFEGQYRLGSYYGSVNLTFVPDKANKQYIIKGLSNYFDVVANYIPSAGTLEIDAQSVGESNGTIVWMAMWSLASGGSLTWDTTVGVRLKWNKNAEAPAYTLVDNGSGFDADSFILWGTAGGSSTGAFSGWTFNGMNSYQFPYITTLTKIVN